VKKSIRIASGNELARSVERSLDEYFRKLDGEPPHCIYEMVIAHVERALLTSILDRSNGNQTHAAEMLGLNRNTLRAKLAKYKLI
jgi:Fis family transcriptional regulator